MYRIHKEVFGYLDFEVFDISRSCIIERFSEAVRAKGKKSMRGRSPEEKIAIQTQIEAEIEEVVWHPERYIETLGPGVTIDGEGFWP